MDMVMDSLSKLLWVAEAMHAQDRSVDLQTLIKAGRLLLVRVRQAYKAAALDAENLRSATREAKTRLDMSAQPLQNLEYEKQYYENETRECNSFRSAHSDAEVDLIPEAEFLQQLEAAAAAAAPEEQPARLERLQQLRADPHALMLARLEQELEARKALLLHLHDAEMDKRRLEDELDAKRSAFERMEQQLEAGIKTMQPLRASLPAATADASGIAGVGGVVQHAARQP